MAPSTVAVDTMAGSMAGAKAARSTSGPVGSCGSTTSSAANVRNNNSTNFQFSILPYRPNADMRVVFLLSETSVPSNSRALLVLSQKGPQMFIWIIYPINILYIWIQEVLLYKRVS